MLYLPTLTNISHNNDAKKARQGPLAWTHLVGPSRSLGTTTKPCSPCVKSQPDSRLHALLKLLPTFWHLLGPGLCTGDLC